MELKHKIAAGLLFVSAVLGGSSWYLYDQNQDIAGQPTETISQSQSSQSEQPLAEEEIDYLSESRPVAMSYQRLGIDQEISSILAKQPDETVEVPPTAQQIGWYRLAQTPGEQGATVLLGHLEYDAKQGVFHNLEESRAGDRFRLTRDDGQVVEYEVVEVERVPQDDFPTNKVYFAGGKSAVRLVTCGGAFSYAEDRYSHNVIVYADAVDYS